MSERTPTNEKNPGVRSGGSATWSAKAGTTNTIYTGEIFTSFALFAVET